MEKLKIVNCGCGYKYDKSMINLDFISNSPDIIACNLLKKLPFSDNEVDAIYSSHMIEHFTSDQAHSWLKECHRVLKPGGVIRLVAPDLENACRNYLNELDKVKEGDRKNISRSEYSVIALIDQLVRDESGGMMRRYWASEKCDKDYLLERHGKEVFDQLHGYKKIKRGALQSLKTHPLGAIKHIMGKVFGKLGKTLFGSFSFYKTYQLGKLNSKGEKHKWMYDSFSLSLLLEEAGFTNIQTKKYMESSIPGFDKAKLELNDDGTEYKKHSVYVEANL
ncbi:MAG: methyltransferase domain-containing protein [Lachnospiraceae bacterium]|nr:methyltransferase domain-containing protein [Lachnospiraceae bacterium]